MGKEVEIVIHFTDEYFELLDENENRIKAPDGAFGSCEELLLTYRDSLDAAHRAYLEEHLEQLVTMIQNWQSYMHRRKQMEEE